MTTRTVEIPAAQEITGAKTTLRIEISLRDANGKLNVFFADTEDDLIAGKVLITAGAADQTVTLTTTDSIAGTSYYWVKISGPGIDYTIKDLQLAAGVGTLPWETFIGAGAPVDPADIWSSRLLPTDAEDDEIAQYNASTELWEAVALPSGTAADIDQYDIAARVAAGTGPYVGISPADLAENATPGAGDLIPVWSSGATLQKADIGNISGGGGATQLSDLTDVGVTTPTNRNALVADGDSWESRALVEADISDLQSYAPATQGVTNGDSHDHSGGDGAQIAYSGLSGIPSTFAPSSHATSHQNGGVDEIATATAAANAIPKAGAGGTIDSGWIPDLSSTYATAAKGVTNGDSHDHSGGDGAQIAYSGLSGIPSTFTPATHAASHQNGGADEVATATAAANAIPKAGAGGTLDSGWIPDLSGTYEAVDATILRQSDVDDTPVSGATTVPVSSGWAYGHEVAADPHPGYRLESAAIAISDIDLDGGTDIGTDIAGTDLIFIDYGANGTNRKSAMSRVRTFVRLAQSSQTITTGDVTGAVNAHYLCTIAGLTDNRNITLPTATAGDRIRITTLDGDDTYALIIKGAATVTINGGSAATEITRLFLPDESMEFEATSSTNWQLVDDSRAFERSSLTTGYTGAANQSINSGAYTPITNTIFNTTQFDAGNQFGTATLHSVANSVKWTARRTGIYEVIAGIYLIDSNDGMTVISAIGKNGSVTMKLLRLYASGTSQAAHPMAPALMSLSTGDYVYPMIYHDHGSALNVNDASQFNWFQVTRKY